MYGSHVKILIDVFNRSEGDVLELGCGFFSTPLLKALCWDAHRKFVSFESDKMWATKFQDITKFVSYNTVEIDKHWGMVFIDHTVERRAKDAVRLKDLADYIILHDSEPTEDFRYGYSKIYPLFKYRYDYTKHKNWTTVVSNFYDIIY